MARELPIFPLPIVLFPGAPQSLHIFESRYRRLLSDDEPTEPNEAATLAAAVRQRFARLARALGVLAGGDELAIELSEDPKRLSFQVAAALELEPDAQRALQALRSTTTRLRQLAALLEPLAAGARRRAAVRQRAKRNGTGGPHPRVERTT